MPRSPEELRGLVESYLEELAFTPELGGLEQALRYPLESGGKRIRPVLTLAVGEAAGAEPEQCLPAAAAVELVHTFSLVHDDLPALDDDDERRGRPSAHVAFGEAVAAPRGRRAAGRGVPARALVPDANRRARARPGDARDDRRPVPRRHGRHADLAALHRLKTGSLFAASVGVALWAADVPEREQAPWRAFGDELGLLFQIVDDVLDGDGYALEHGAERARELADEAAERAHDRLAQIDADTSVLAEIVASLAARTA